MPELKRIVGIFVSAVINPLLALLFAAGLLLFAYGVLEFLISLSKGDTTSQNAGKKHMFYGIAGMFVMAAAWSLVKVIGNIVGNPVSNAGF